jgi:mRNA interferase HigB
LSLERIRIVTFSKIKDFAAKYPVADVALRDWYFKTKRSEWDSFNDIKQSFNSADYVGNNRFVFNIKGNDFRLVAIIIFASLKVYIRFIGTRSEYDKIDCSTI